MNGEQAYEMKIEELRKIEPNCIRKIHHIPVDVYAQEAETLYHWAKSDEDQLKKRGLDWELVEELPLRAGALRQAQLLWYMWKNSPFTVQKEWKRLFSEVRRFRAEIVEDYRYAFRDQAHLLDHINAAVKRKGAAYVNQSLVELYDIGRKNMILLEQIGFDMSKLDRLDEIITEASQLKGRASAARKEVAKEKNIRDQAFTHLKDAVDKIRVCGKFVFRKDEKRLVGYRSEYLHKKNLKLKTLRGTRTSKAQSNNLD